MLNEMDIFLNFFFFVPKPYFSHDDAPFVGISLKQLDI